MGNLNERDLEAIARRLGDRAARSVDPDRVAAGILARLRSAPPAQDRPIVRLFFRAPVALRVAAAIAVLVTGGLVTRTLLVDPREPVTLIAPFLPELSADELTEVLDSLAFEAPLPEDLAVGLTDLTESQLRELLRLMEG
ncbi:MAG: hypothetical protein HY337_06085 [Gemmatimonadetes bacterium]|nr:hypothetical protein [Gemmatimonadota bacterium]